MSSQSTLALYCRLATVAPISRWPRTFYFLTKNCLNSTLPKSLMQWEIPANQTHNETKTLLMTQDQPWDVKPPSGLLCRQRVPPLHQSCMSGEPTWKHGTTIRSHSHSSWTPSWALELVAGSSCGSKCSPHHHSGLSPSADGAARGHGHVTAQWSLPRGQPVLPQHTPATNL